MPSPSNNNNNNTTDEIIQRQSQDGYEVAHVSNNNNNNGVERVQETQHSKNKSDEIANNTSPRKNSNNDATNSSNSSNDNEMTPNEPPLFSVLTGMKEDLKVRLPYLKSDWGKPDNVFTVVNATIFAFVIQLIPALIFAELMERQTKGNLSVAEVLLSSAIIGIIYAIFAGQPIVIMGITGPVAILLGTSYSLTETFDAEYFPFFFWTCIWAGLLHILSAMIGLVSLVWKVTPFTSQIFELFIATTFIYSSVRDLIRPLNLGENDDLRGRATGYAAFFIGLITCYIAWTLHFAETSNYGYRQVRVVCTSYNTLIAVVIGTAVSYIPGIDQGGQLDRVQLKAPWDWQPTADRPWITHPFEGIDGKGIAAAFVPGFMFFLLFIIDHNVSSILAQSPKYNLKKPPAYHWDFFVLGITFIPCAVLGIPPGNGLIPQAPLHVRALCQREHVTDEYGVTREVVTHCEEQRWSGLAQALLMLVALAAFGVIKLIPKGCLFGLFLYLGMGALHGNEIWERLCLFFVLGKKRPAIPIVRNVRWPVVQAFTLIQAACALAIFGVAQFANVGYIYPALLTLLVPFRSYVLERVFKSHDLKYLDPYDETEEDYEDEQRKVLKQRSNSVDEVDLAFPTRAAFRGQGFKTAVLNAKRRHTIGHGENDDVLALDIVQTQVKEQEDTATKINYTQAQVVDASEKAYQAIYDSMGKDKAA